MEVGTIESLLMDKGRYSYPSYMEFDIKNRVSLYQLDAYGKVLQQNGSSFEKEMK